MKLERFEIIKSKFELFNARMMSSETSHIESLKFEVERLIEDEGEECIGDIEQLCMKKERQLLKNIEEGNEQALASEVILHN